MQGTQGVVNTERNNVNSNGYVSSKLCFEIPRHGMSEMVCLKATTMFLMASCTAFYHPSVCMKGVH